VALTDQVSELAAGKEEVQVGVVATCGPDRPTPGTHAGDAALVG
jgi:hypothetical protein